MQTHDTGCGSFRYQRSLAWMTLAVVLSATAACNTSDRRSGRDREKTDTQSPYWPKTSGQALFHETQYASLQVPAPTIEEAEYVEDDSLCMNCHESYVKSFKHNVHQGQSCEKCHGPASLHMKTRGKEPGTILSFKTLSAPQKAEICLKCHEQNQCEPGSTWRTSAHAHHGVSCTDCHTGHYNVAPGTPATSVALSEVGSPNQLVSFNQPAAESGAAESGAAESGSAVEMEVSQAQLREDSHHMGALSPQVCYRCHGDLQRFEHIAHPHQINGSNGFTCSTCHDAHGKIRRETRTDLCLKCHSDAPTMAWHSGPHSMNNVGCTDCHHPHPETDVPSVVNIQHTNIRRPLRMPMSVDEPNACYKCHPAIYAAASMPSRHPVKEGKMTCSSCHDAHTQSPGQGSLNQPTVNLVCYRCHAEKQGPFVYEHPPVTENCDICHDPHGAVTNNLLKQPTTFLCLRCHTGHRTGPTFGPHTGAGVVDVGNNASLQQAYYTDCTQCHSQVHGSDLPSPHLPKAFVR